ncbi:MAG: penicillin-binding protein 2 [Chloroflexota bacterium]|nr:penicillin-binding protein 2 [Chloroflexota bacterium]
MNETEDRTKSSSGPTRYRFQKTASPELKGKRGVTARPQPRTRLSSQPTNPAIASDSKEKEERPKRRWHLSSLMRVRLTLLAMVLISVVLLVRLYALQVQQSPYGDLRKRAADMHMKETIIPARRGIIRDTNGLVLASNITVYRIWASPQGLTEKQSDRSTTGLAKLLPSVPQAKIKDALTYKPKQSNYNLIANGVDSAIADKIRELNLPGVDLEPQMRRVYPNGSMMGQLLGFANYENVGAYGIEGGYEQVLKGKPGIIIAESDPDGNPIVLGQRQISDPEDGGDLTLTIDSSIQLMVERELKKGMEEHRAEAASAIVMDPNTGAILAWASFPNYDPNEFYKTEVALLKDPLVGSTYEPGSTFKILTAAIGIDTGVVTPDSWANLPGCALKYGRTICNYNSVGYSHQTVVDTLMHSSNVGAMWIAEKFGPQKYYDYLKRFGMGVPTGVDLQGEAEGIVRWQENKDWIPLDMMTNSFGQSIAVTPLQLVTAVSAVANGGNLIKPYIVAKITREDKVIKETKPEIVRKNVIKPESAKTTTDMLVQAVRKGETRLADVKGYRVAGKTGTSTLYDSSLTIGSTIAYAPADNPRFLVYVRYDKTKDTPWGSNTAAPVVKTITENLFSRFNIPPSEAGK